MVYLNIGYGVTLINRIWLTKKLFLQIISTIPHILKFRDIINFTHKLGKFALTTNYIPDDDKEGYDVYISNSYKLHLVNWLKVYILIANNVFYLKRFIIDFLNILLLIHNYSMKINISAQYYFKFLSRKVITNSSIFMLLQSEASIAFLHIHLPISHNFLFHLLLSNTPLFIPNFYTTPSLISLCIIMPTISYRYLGIPCLAMSLMYLIRAILQYQ